MAVAFPLGFESGKPLWVFAVPFLIEGEREQHLERRFRNCGERCETLHQKAQNAGIQSLHELQRIRADLALAQENLQALRFKLASALFCRLALSRYLSCNAPRVDGRHIRSRTSDYSRPPMVAS